MYRVRKQSSGCLGPGMAVRTDCAQHGETFRGDRSVCSKTGQWECLRSSSTLLRIVDLYTGSR